jgi:hypothetical protein
MCAVSLVSDVLGAGDGALCAEALVCLDTKWLREECVAGTYVFFKRCGTCLLSLDLPSRRLLVDFAALPEATALDAQNLSPVVTTFRGCVFAVELNVWTGSPSSIGLGHSLLSRQRSRRRMPFFGPHMH